MLSGMTAVPLPISKLLLREQKQKPACGYCWEKVPTPPQATGCTSTAHSLRGTWPHLRPGQQAESSLDAQTAQTVSAGQCGGCTITFDLIRNKHPHMNHNKRNMRGQQETLHFNFLALNTLCLCVHVYQCMCVYTCVFSLNYFNTKLLCICSGYALTHGWGGMTFLW